MLKKLERKFEEKLERWETNKITACMTLSLIIMALSIFVLAFVTIVATFSTEIGSIFFAIPISAYVILIVAMLIITFLSYKATKISTKVYDKQYDEKMRDSLINDLKCLLSTKELKPVKYRPSCNNEDLKYCAELLENEGVRYYAKLTENDVYVIIKNKEGVEIGHRNVDVHSFLKDYKM